MNLASVFISISVALCAVMAAAAVYADNRVNWTYDLHNILLTAGFIGFTIPIISWWLRLHISQSLCLAIAIAYLASGSGPALIGVSGFWIGSLGIGAGLVSLLFKTDEISKDDSAFVQMSLLLGYAVIACILGLLSLTRFNYSGVYVILFGSLFLMGLWAAGGAPAFKPFFRRETARSSFDPSAIIAKGLFCTTIFVLCIAALLPETKSDAVAAYRAIIVEMIDTGGFVYDPETSSIRLQSLLGLWPQSFAAILTSDDTTAKALNFSTLVAAAILLYCWTERRFGDVAAALAGACLLATPILFLTSVSAFLDNALIFLVTGLLIITHVLSGSSRITDVSVKSSTIPAWRAGIVLGLISAVLVMSKMTSLFLAPSIALYIVVTLWKTYSLRNLIVLTIVITGMVALLFGPFLLFVYTKTGNPLFPYYNEVFQSPYFGNKNFESAHGGYFDIRLFWDMMVNTSQYASIDGRSTSSNRDGQLGVISVLMLFSLLSFFTGFLCRQNNSPGTKLYATHESVVTQKWSGGLALLCAGVGIFVVSIMQNNSRYLLPVLPFIGIALGAAIQTLSIGRIGRWSVTMTGAVIVFASFSLLPQFGYNPTKFGGIWQPNHKEIIADVSSIQIASDRMSERYGSSGRVVFDHRDGGFEGQSLIAGWYDYTTVNAYSRAKTNGEGGLEEFLRDLNVDAFVMTGRTIDQTTAAGNFRVLQTLERLAQTSEVIGDVHTFSFPPDISFDRSIQMKPVEPLKSGVLALGTGAQTASLRIHYACAGSGTLLLSGRKSGLMKGTTQKSTFVCDGHQRQISLRVNELNPDKTVVVRGFFKDFKFTLFEGILYLRD